MSHRLVLVRHARAAASNGPDLLRPLTEEGERQAVTQGARLRDIGETGMVLCSPAARCVQTARGLLEGMGRREAPDVLHELADSASAHATLAAALGSRAGSILVGHQPGLVDLASKLLGGAGLPFTLAPASAIVLRREQADAPWMVATVLPPP